MYDLDTINEAVQTVADRLSRLSPSRPINVVSMVYSRSH